MATTADIKNGMCLKLESQYFFVVEFLHVKPGKGPAFVRTKLKNVKTGRVIDKTFNAGVKIEDVSIERHQYQFLYKDDMGYNFMNTDSYEQITIEKELINGVDFLKDGELVDVVIQPDTETIFYVDIPVHVALKITYTEPGIKGDTATNTLKPATVETGAEVRIPLFLNTGDTIMVDTRDGSYLERVKE